MALFFVVIFSMPLVPNPWMILNFINLVLLTKQQALLKNFLTLAPLKWILTSSLKLSLVRFHRLNTKRPFLSINLTKVKKIVKPLRLHKLPLILKVRPRMSKKLAILISTLVGSVSAAAIALVTYFEPSNASVINGLIELVTTTAVTFINALAKPVQVR